MCWSEAWWQARSFPDGARLWGRHYLNPLLLSGLKPTGKEGKQTTKADPQWGGVLSQIRPPPTPRAHTPRRNHQLPPTPA